MRVGKDSNGETSHAAHVRSTESVAIASFPPRKPHRGELGGTSSNSDSSGHADRRRVTFASSTASSASTSDAALIAPASISIVALAEAMASTARVMNR